MKRDWLDVTAIAAPTHVSVLVLPYGIVACPPSVEAARHQAISGEVFDQSPRFQAYLERQEKRMLEHFLADDPEPFVAEDWADGPSSSPAPLA